MNKEIQKSFDELQNDFGVLSDELHDVLEKRKALTGVKYVTYYQESSQYFLKKINQIQKSLSNFDHREANYLVQSIEYQKRRLIFQNRNFIETILDGLNFSENQYKGISFSMNEGINEFEVA